MRNSLKHLGLNMVGVVARGTAKAESRDYEMPPLTFRGRAFSAPSSTPEGRWRHFCFDTMSDSSSEEVWKPVPGYEGSYEVSSLGRVRSKDRKVETRAGWSKEIKGRLLSPCEAGVGYLTVQLYDGSGGQRFYIHRLVARAFMGEPNGGLVVNHKDHDPQNNSVENLEWVTQAENLRDARESTDVNPSGVDAYQAKLTRKDVAEIKYLLSDTDLYQYEIAEKYSVQQSTISKINTGDRFSEVEAIRHDEDVRQLDIVWQDEERIHA